MALVEELEIEADAMWTTRLRTGPEEVPGVGFELRLLL
jgi:hypothetical protein